MSVTPRVCCEKHDWEHDVESMAAALHDVRVHVGDSEVFGDGPCEPTVSVGGDELRFDQGANDFAE